MQTTASIRIPDTSTTPSLACLRSAAFASPSISTGKERDTESGNDYFGARYYASSMGRFLSPDPMLSSGRPSNPQTWNRYAYVGNNPLRNIDPTGLYFFTNTCASSDKACNAAFTQTQTNVRSMYASTQAAYDKAVKAGDTKAAAALKRTLDGLGAEGQKNARGQTVNISVNLGLNAPGYTQFAGPSTISVQLNPTIGDGAGDAQATAAHEGSNAGEITPGKRTLDQTYQIEHDANETESYFDQAIGHGESFAPPGGGMTPEGAYDPSSFITLWNPSWANADAATVNSMRTKGIDAKSKIDADADCANGGCKK